MSPSARLTRARRTRRLVPLVVVAATACLVFVGLAFSPTFSNSQNFAFGAYWPSPSAYYPGSTPPNVYLQINYTGTGSGSYTYSITYYSASGHVTATSGSVLVSSLSPFTAYVTIPTSQSGTVVVTANVYAAGANQNLVYSKSISL